MRSPLRCLFGQETPPSLRARGPAGARAPRRIRPDLEGLEVRITPSKVLTGDFDGVPGNEVATINGTSVHVSSLATGVSGDFKVAPWNYVQTLELDGQPGGELVFTNLAAVNGFAQPSGVSILDFRLKTVHSYQVGSPNSMQVAELDGQAGSELLFTNLMTINGSAQSAQATVVTARTGQVQTYQVGKPNSMQILDLDGQAGGELLFTNLMTINGFGQPAQATVVTARTGQVQSYQVGSPNSMQVAELDGQAGSELLFTNLMTINGFGQPAQATAVTARTGQVQTYQVGKPNSMQILDLDGQAGGELLFTNLMTINGFGQPAQATVVTARTGQVQTYQVGSPTSLSVSNLDGLQGSELVFAGSSQVTVVTPGTHGLDTYAVGPYSYYQITNYDGIAGNEIVFTRADGHKTIVVQRTKKILFV